MDDTGRRRLLRFRRMDLAQFRSRRCCKEIHKRWDQLDEVTLCCAGGGVNQPRGQSQGGTNALTLAGIAQTFRARR